MPNSNWVYADLPANERLEMIRNGDEDVYNQEVERSKEVIQSREELGLDIEAQKKWLDELGYQRSLYRAEQSGIPTGQVSTTGYANMILKDNSQQAKGSKKSYSTGQVINQLVQDGDEKNLLSVLLQLSNSSAKKQRDSLDAQYKKYVKDVTAQYNKLKQQAIENANNALPKLRESMIMGGHSLNGGTTIAEEMQLKKQLNEVLADYDKQMQQDLSNARNSLNSEFANISSQHNNDLQNQINQYMQLILEQQKFDYSKTRDAASDQKWADEFDLRKTDSDRNFGLSLRDADLREKQVDQSFDQWLAEFQEAQKQNEIKNDQWNSAFTEQMNQDKIANEQWEKSFQLQQSNSNALPKANWSPSMQDPTWFDEKSGDGKPLREYIEYVRSYVDANSNLDGTGETYFVDTYRNVLDWLNKQQLTEEQRNKVINGAGLPFIDEHELDIQSATLQVKDMLSYRSVDNGKGPWISGENLQEVFEWVQTLPFTDEEKKRIMSEAGVPGITDRDFDHDEPVKYIPEIKMMINKYVVNSEKGPYVSQQALQTIYNRILNLDLTLLQKDWLMQTLGFTRDGKTFYYNVTAEDVYYNYIQKAKDMLDKAKFREHGMIKISQQSLQKVKDWIAGLDVPDEAKQLIAEQAGLH